MIPSPSAFAPCARLEALAGVWAAATTAEAVPDGPARALDSFRCDLHALAAEAEAAETSSAAQAMRRVALLSEVWECLHADPGHKDADDELVTFCSQALSLLARGETHPSRDSDFTARSILSESAKRWKD